MSSQGTSQEVDYSIGHTIRDRRRELGMTQAEAAAAAGLSITTWSKLERDDGPFSVRVRRAVTRAIGCSPWGEVEHQPEDEALQWVAREIAEIMDRLVVINKVIASRLGSVEMDPTAHRSDTNGSIF